MKTFIKVSFGTLVVFFSFGFTTKTIAATTPSLGVAATYGVLAGTYSNTSAATTINGDVGFTTGPATAPLGVHTNYGAGAPTPTARINAGNALTSLASQPCTFNFAGGAIDLSTDGPNGATGVYAPGVYCSTGAMNIGVGGITMNGAGTYIFRAVGALTSTDNSHVTLSGSSACNLFWTPTAATTLGANTTFAGTIIDNANAITVGANTTWMGSALSLGAGSVTTGATDTITVPVCATIPIPSTGGTSDATINVVKTVINDNGGTKIVADFPLYINSKLVVSGVTNQFPVPAVYTITETTDPQYTATFSGDCDSSGHVSLNYAAEDKFCIITNNDIGAPAVPPVPPLIDLVKVPSPLALPAGPGVVKYTYTLRNTGTVPVTNITMIGDTCSPIILISGDTNADAKLDVNEIWVHTCSTTLSETHTNTVVATGWANGLSTTDIASATVIVGGPTVHPLIHITKVPHPLTLPAVGGIVTYTEKITNPGTVPLNNVHLTDDKCSPMNYISGDVNNDAKLDMTETWTYACQSNLTKTTTNTAVATGEANGLTVRDFAIATVVVATTTPITPVIPKLPNTGLPPAEESTPWNIILLMGIIGTSFSIYIFRGKKT